MKKFFPALLLALFFCFSTAAQKKFNVYAIGFYNLENLFDTCHDIGKNDYEFLPSGSYKWNGMKYSHKLHNMARALSDMGTTMLPRVGCSVIGVSEVENDKVLTDLCSQPELSERGYKFCHVEGPDHRGIDCALLYNPTLFTVKGMRLYPYVPTEKQDSLFRTRGFLAVSGELGGEHVVVIVNHLPSRFSNGYYREVGAAQIKELKDRVLKMDPQAKVIVMGDMNDDPTNKSMHVILSAKEEPSLVGDDDMYNPWYNVLVRQGTGTLQYQGSWNLFDQIILSPSLLDRDGKKDFSTLKFFKNEVQRMPYLFQKEGKYKGNTHRTTAGGVWLDGYSDHLPTVVYLVKEQPENKPAALDENIFALPDYTEAELKNIASYMTEKKCLEEKDTKK
ncbi:endonuclease/exonuclease/phosphatase family protein [Hallella multisaccharivorax]|uniref:endonuclease/exonuclease/phosphatase family protein n=1 Tax=Hallella multisaccharivorax TaxID=310514 RepID=UPI00360F8BD0